MGQPRVVAAVLALVLLPATAGPLGFVTGGWVSLPLLTLSPTVLPARWYGTAWEGNNWYGNNWYGSWTGSSSRDGEQTDATYGQPWFGAAWFGLWE